MNSAEQDRILSRTVRLLAEKCPRLMKTCYWAGASSIALEELHHRQSFDLDFHTRRALEDVRPILAEIQKIFSNRFEIVKPPDQFGSGFTGVLTTAEDEKVTIEILSNFEDVEEKELTDAITAPGVKRVTRERFLADKIQCIAERSEARDLVDIIALVRKYPGMANQAREILANQDALIITERLLLWSDRAIEDDLSVYIDVNSQDAIEARDLLLELLKPDE